MQKSRIQRIVIIIVSLLLFCSKKKKIRKIKKSKAKKKKSSTTCSKYDSYSCTNARTVSPNDMYNYCMYVQTIYFYSHRQPMYLFVPQNDYSNSHTTFFFLISDEVADAARWKGRRWQPLKNNEIFFSCLAVELGRSPLIQAAVDLVFLMIGWAGRDNAKMWRKKICIWRDVSAAYIAVDGISWNKELYGVNPASVDPIANLPTKTNPERQTCMKMTTTLYREIHLLKNTFMEYRLCTVPTPPTPALHWNFRG